jgi:hypothetical protein
MTQMARNGVDETSGCLRHHRYVLHDRDAKFCAAFDDLVAVRRRPLPDSPAAEPESEGLCFTLHLLCSG